MADREKVIKGLEEISDYFFSVYHHAKDREEIIEAKDRCDAVENALALLKEQEAVEPTWSHGKPFCGACGLRIRGGKFCGECGKPIMWEEMKLK